MRMMNKLNKRLQGLYAITDVNLMGEQLLEMSKQAILGGIHILQYRNKTATLQQQENEALALAHLCKKHHVLFLINDNIDLALKVNADGVHLGQTDTQLLRAREKLGQEKIIGITCHNKIELAITAQEQGADYVAFGRFYTSHTKPTAPPADISILSNAKQSINIPIVAVGGITIKTAPDLLEQDADMLAVINAIFGEKDVMAATQQFVDFFPSGIHL